MKSFLGGLISLILSVSVGAEPLLEGRVRLSSGQPAVGVQVRLVDLTDLRHVDLHATTDAAGYFALSLQTLSGGTALPTELCAGAELPQPVQSFDRHSLPTIGCLTTCGWTCSMCWGSG